MWVGNYSRSLRNSRMQLALLAGNVGREPLERSCKEPQSTLRTKFYFKSHVLRSWLNSLPKFRWSAVSEESAGLIRIRFWLQHVVEIWGGSQDSFACFEEVNLINQKKHIKLILFKKSYVICWWISVQDYSIFLYFSKQFVIFQNSKKKTNEKSM